MWTASIVVYQPRIDALEAVLRSACATPGLARGIVVDNGASEAAAELVAGFPQFEYLRNPQGNAGFGNGHNFALRQLAAFAEQAPWHAVLNPDIRFAPEVVPELIAVMQAAPEVVLTVPALFFPDGERQYLCKRYPTLRALIARRFLSPRWAQRLGFAADAAFFEMRDADYETMLEPEFLSGCFMLFRREAYQRLGGFDERFFMYFEDADITLRARRIGRALHVPTARIVHEWARGSHRSFRLMLVTIASAFKLFNKHGWRWRDPRLRERSRLP